MGRTVEHADGDERLAVEPLERRGRDIGLGCRRGGRGGAGGQRLDVAVHEEEVRVSAAEDEGAEVGVGLELGQQREQGPE